MRRIKNKRGQMITSEYIILFFMAIGAIIAMTVFVQRALQGRVHDARNYMIQETSAAYQGNIDFGYEPYYGNVTTLISRNQKDTSRILQGGGTGIFRKVLNQQVGTQSVSDQAPPKNAD